MVKWRKVKVQDDIPTALHRSRGATSRPVGFGLSLLAGQ